MPRSCEDYFLRRRHQHSTHSSGSFLAQTAPSYRNANAKTRRVQSSNLTIDLDGGGPLKPFNVVCSRFGEGDVDDDDATILGWYFINKIFLIIFLEHNLLTPGGIYVNGPTEPGAVRRQLEYGVEGEELDRLIDGFDSCRQFMRFECQGGAKLMTYGQERRPSSKFI